MGVFAPLTAAAAPYETFIDVDDEEDLQDLNAAGDITGETYETLVELMRRGVDLNEATRDDLYTLPNLSYEQVDAIIAFRKEVGYIADPASLVVSGVIDQKTMAAIASFLVVSEAGRKLRMTNGRIRYRTAFSQRDRQVPPMALDAQIQTARHLSLGFAAVLNRLQPGDVRWDPNRQALSAEGPAPRLRLPKVYAMWDTEKWGIIAGTYRIGFGQRLTFDNTRNYTPNGFYRDQYIYPRRVDLTGACRESAGELGESPCAGEIGDTYITPDFRWQQTLRGIAVGAKHIDAGPGWIQAYGWGSYDHKDIYQYRLYNAELCEDPANDDDPACAALDVYKRRDNPLEPTTELSYATLPRMYREAIGGANASYFINRRSHVGVTGYGADIKWLTEGADLDFQEWDRTPYGGPFGALGLNGAWGHRWSDLGVEVARSFDSMRQKTPETGGGGFAAIARHTATWGTKNAHQIETILRFYDTDYSNPYARPLSSPDIFDGTRARDEAGGRLLYQGRFNKKYNLRTYVNLWMSPSDRTPQMITYLRADAQVAKWVVPGLWLQYQDKDLRQGGREECFGGDPTYSSLVSGDDDFEDIPLPGLEETEPPRCRGAQMRINVLAKFIPHRKVTITPRYQHRWIDDSRYTGRFRQDAQAWLTVNARPLDPMRVRLRMRYLFQGIDDNTYLEQSLWSYLSVGYLFKRTFLAQIRYDVYTWLDARESTQSRIPSPENRLFLELEGRF
ncbi:MAG: helix-hairpin-helix domain-containing protein [Myxococcales bacterium]|nr:helix-hairpin-helix domain-containing protein [Myxococcales bacterium]